MPPILKADGGLERRRRLPEVLCTAFLVLLASGTQAPAQRPASHNAPKAPPTDIGFVEETEISLIFLDVEVYRKDGTPTRGLTQEDFHVFQRNHEWDIYSVDDLCEAEDEEETGAASPMARTGPAPPQNLEPERVPLPAPQRRATNRPSERLFVMYFDFSQLRPDGRKRAQAGAERWVRELMRPTDRLMMAGFATGAGLVRLIDFSSDKSEILDRLGQAFEDGALFDAFPAGLKVRLRVCRRVPLMCRSYAIDELRHSRASFRMFQTLLRTLNQVEGSKTLFLFTQNGGLFPREYYVPERRSYAATAPNNWSLLQEVAADAVTSRTIINTVNAGQPQFFEPVAEQAVSTGFNFADFTGGDYNRGPGDTFDLLQRSTNKPRCVYRIGLSPSQATPGRTYGVRIEVTGQVLPHRYRVQLLTVADRIWRHFTAALTWPETADAFPLYAAIHPLGIQGRKWRVNLQVGMALGSLLEMPLPEGAVKRWEIAGLLAKVDGIKNWEFAGRQSLPGRDAGAEHLHILHNRIMEIKPGDYQFRAAVRDAVSQKYAATQVHLHLPKPGREGIVGPLCTIVRPSLRLDLPQRSSSNKPQASRVEGALMPCGEARLTGDGPFLMETWLCTHGKEADASIAVRGYVDRDGIPFYRLGSPRLRTSGSCLQIDHLIDTNLLSPGRYNYHVLVPGAGKSQIEIGSREFRLETQKPPETPAAASVQ